MILIKRRKAGETSRSTLVCLSEDVASLEAEHKQIIFDLMTFAKLVYDYLNVGDKIMTKDELEEMALNEIKRMKALEE